MTDCKKCGGVLGHSRTCPEFDATFRRDEAARKTDMSNEEIKLPRPRWKAGDFEAWAPVYTENEVRHILAARAARPVADAGEAVGEVVACHPVHGWHFKPYDDWETLAAGTKLYTRAATSARTLSDEEIEATFKAYQGQWDGDRWVIEDADFHPCMRALLAASTPAEAPSVRDQALDEVAVLCEQLQRDWADDGQTQKGYAAEYIGSAIRALQGKPEAAKGGN